MLRVVGILARKGKIFPRKGTFRLFSNFSVFCCFYLLGCESNFRQTDSLKHLLNASFLHYNNSFNFFLNLV